MPFSTEPQCSPHPHNASLFLRRVSEIYLGHAGSEHGRKAQSLLLCNHLEHPGDGLLRGGAHAHPEATRPHRLNDLGRVAAVENEAAAPRVPATTIPTTKGKRVRAFGVNIRK